MEALDELFIWSTSPTSIWLLFRSFCSGKTAKKSHVQATAASF